MGLAAEESSSSYPDESGLELGLTLGGGGGGINKFGFGSLSSSSSSSSSHLTQAPLNNGASNQVVGWPPIRAYRMNSMANQIQSSVEKSKTKNDNMDMNLVEEQKKSNFVKVRMDGNGIGRKVDLSAHNCYETLAQTIEGMFCGAATTRRSSAKEHDLMMGGTRSSKLLDGSSEFVLTYEDKDGDWMLVGDVPWGMFINSVKRLRIMRTSEANGLGSKFQVRNVRQCLPI